MLFNSLAAAVYFTLACFALAMPAHAGDATLAKARIEPIPDAIWSNMQGKSWHGDVKGCATREELSFLTVPFHDFQGNAKLGQMIVAKSVATDVMGVFKKLYITKSYAFDKIELVDAYGGDDHASLVANNTSAYNCRVVAGSTKLSSHARGLAIDINPVQNPFVTSKVVSPPAGAPYDTAKERLAAKALPGMILKTSAITTAFRQIGWGWGGAWTSLKDYQHFSADGH